MWEVTYKLNGVTTIERIDCQGDVIDAIEQFWVKHNNWSWKKITKIEKILN